MLHHNSFNSILIFKLEQELDRAILGLIFRNLGQGNEFKLILQLVAKCFRQVRHLIETENAFDI
ncbi:hypothetical protein D3C85_1807430 [compost metagenome]